METSIASRSRKIEFQNGEETPSLPEEIIIEEILPRLPVKSLLKFRCVAKSWRSLISSKKFTHLRNSIKSSNFVFCHTARGFEQCCLPSLFNEPSTDLITHNVDFGSHVLLVGCCNGLVCVLMDRRRFVLWNPSTKKYNSLPEFDCRLKFGSITKYGFGFDELNDDYKVFGLLSLFCPNGQYFSIRKVYSLRTNSWEVIEGKDGSPFDEGGTYVSGKLHWDIRKSCKLGIASFDLSSKVCGVVKLPSYLTNYRLGVMKGCLSVHCFQMKSHVDIWVMKKYGLNDSWDKVATVPYYHGPRGYIPTPFTIGPNGDVLLIYESTFLIYNPKENVFRHPRVTDPTLTIIDLGIFVESLASVVPDAEQEN